MLLLGGNMKADMTRIYNPGNVRETLGYRRPAQHDPAVTELYDRNLAPVGAVESGVVFLKGERLGNIPVSEALAMC